MADIPVPSTLAPSTLGDALRQSAAAKRQSIPSPQVQKIADEFESMVLGQLLQPMFEAMDADGLFGGGEGERMFRPMLVDQYAQGIVQSGGIGIAEAVARELMRIQAEPAQSGEENADGPAR